MSTHSRYIPNFLWSLVFVFAFTANPLWAEEEFALDTSDPPAEVPDEAAQYSGPPMINFHLSDEDYLLIKIDGLKLDEVDGFSFDGMDISELVGQYKEAGIIDLPERDDGFQVNVNIPIRQLAGQHEFGVIYGGGTKLSARMDSETLLEEKADGDRGFGFTRVYGTVTQRGGCCYCGGCGTTVAAYARVDIYTWQGGWVYRGSTTANASGYFDAYVQGYNASHIMVAASKSGMSSAQVFTGPACACTNAIVRSNLYLR